MILLETVLALFLISSVFPARPLTSNIPPTLLFSLCPLFYSRIFYSAFEVCSDERLASFSKHAFVFPHDLRTSVDVEGLAEALGFIRTFHSNNITDILLLIPPRKITRDLESVLFKYRAAVVRRRIPEVSPSVFLWSERRRNCCSWREYLKLTAWTLVQYDSVIVIDIDQRVLQTLDNIFACASRGYFLYTSGPLSPLNAGFFALRPLYPIYDDMVTQLAQVTFRPSDGFEGTGFGKPGWFRDNPPKNRTLTHAPYGAEGPQGFLYYYFVLKRSHLERYAYRPAELDRCIWNYQKEGLARADKHPCSGYAQPPSLVHKQDSYARSLVQKKRAQVKLFLEASNLKD
uniref:Hexosyltransferase n=1 Tax=Tetraselmis sp. GSL018 TaxID=582737 RepID=A0A061SH77_9CHLO|mmetsp:Transcript_16999/g.40558  ORF Transcript_16999/g.40558 Transcript_16999/m.40558 type:complete len:345 (-) Transcript_16999:185-1219(-)|eukprot:CAMPEP_0177588418 /NCGR_PEP_ID=MMETSP0419_2-20121207/6213_1 /TAXON_ID=582737 /ORGANISM="Tetraselmis sp., Strain GSL018" /LENGTH=344 /DNA_ID=CAMNT_0019078611 /DNA_START=274 /DNA_END=1308 /DNA_ORIENTATION=-